MEIRGNSIQIMTFVFAGMNTVTGQATTVFLSLAGTQEMMAKIITTTKREKFNLLLY